MNEDDIELTDEEIAAFLEKRPPTLPEFQYSIRGLDESLGQALVDRMHPLALFMSRMVPLHGLDGITVAVDYAAALAELDRGVETAERLEPTVESFGTGVAMSSGCIRNGEAKTHVTFEASIIVGLLSDDPEIVDLSTHTFMHELGHVAEHTLDWQRFGEALVRPFEDEYEFELYRLSHSCWGEYYASRVSANWGAGDTLESLRELLQGQLEQFTERLAAARAKVGFLGGANNDDAANQIIDQMSKLMKFAGYVIGHARGTGVAPFERDSPIDQMLRTLGLLKWFEELAAKLDHIYDTREEWEEVSVYFPLHRSFEEACLAFKLEIYRREGYRLAWRIWF